MVLLHIINLLLATLVFANKDPHFVDDRGVIVHLFEWKWKTIAKECENFLGPMGYGGVQISPPNENLVIKKRPWWERYQPVSYFINTRSGNEAEFLDMTKRCNRVGVRIYADVVFNHMAAGDGTGTAGSPSMARYKYYQNVPYNDKHFHKTCIVNDYQNPSNVRNCELVGLKDLDQSIEYVRGKIVDYLNHLIDLGVAGFRIDAAKHMWPRDLKEIYGRIKSLNRAFGFKENSRPYIYQEVIDNGGEAITRDEYTDLGAVLDFKYSGSIGNVFKGNDKLTYLRNWGPEWGFIRDPKTAVVFVDNHDNQRSGDKKIMTHKSPKHYKMAVGFMLAHPYGTPRVMSSFFFDDKDAGPPSDPSGNIIPPGFNADNTCTNGYVCEHRWREIYNMVRFRNAARGTGVNNWWSDGNQQIAFCRGEVAFVAFTNGGDINRELDVCVPPGVYCDIISGDLVSGRCTGKTISVGQNRRAFVSLKKSEMDGLIAITKFSRRP